MATYTCAGTAEVHAANMVQYILGGRIPVDSAVGPQAEAVWLLANLFPGLPAAALLAAVTDPGGAVRYIGRDAVITYPDVPQTTCTTRWLSGGKQHGCTQPLGHAGPCHNSNEASGHSPAYEQRHYLTDQELAGDTGRVLRCLDDHLAALRRALKDADEAFGVLLSDGSLNLSEEARAEVSRRGAVLAGLLEGGPAYGHASMLVRTEHVGQGSFREYITIRPQNRSTRGKS